MLTRQTCSCVFVVARVVVDGAALATTRLLAAAAAAAATTVVLLAGTPARSTVRQFNSIQSRKV